MSRTLLAFPSALSSELLHYILAQETHPTTLIVCQSHEDFMESLHKNISQAFHEQPVEKTIGGSNLLIKSQIPSWEPQHGHDLLTPTIGQVAASQRTSVVFTPTLSHLRAFLAVFSHQNHPNYLPISESTDTKIIPSLVLFGLVDLHEESGQSNLQELGNTISGLVEAGQRTESKILLVEPLGLNNIVSSDIEDIDLERRGVWERRIPLLGSSVKYAGPFNEENERTGRTVEIKKVIEQWFEFVDHKWGN
ncbi:unnamed protein product [Blumeria hordei]|uniref:Uncharacterized protein n=2 Tax=Blumeria hordei TaxID=2867405 RepID=A0A383UI62_BLUHO|nr:hypothetical protein BGHDH14_bgh04976 [Blumeria hordei DH14]SZE99511.1 unnamed protein product [Blumeria hordei]